MTQPLQYRNDSPPYVPNGIVCPPNMQYIIPAICAMIANESAQKCGLHPGRTFLFNQLSYNNWANNDFSTVVSTVIDLLMLNLAKNLYRSIEEGVSSVVSDALSIFCSMNFQNFPALQSVTQPDVVNEAHKNNQAFFSLSNEIMNFKARNQQIPQGYPVQPQPQQMMVNPSFGGGGFQQPQAPLTYQQPQQFTNPYSNNAPLNGNSGLFNKTTTPNANTMQNPKPPSGKYDYLKPPVIEVGKNAINNTTVGIHYFETPPGTSKAYLAPEKELVWIPSTYQFYPLAINPFKEKLCLREVPNPMSYKMSVISYIEPLKGIELDRAQHKITTMSQVYTAMIPDNYGTREESLKDSVDKIFSIDYKEIDSLKKCTSGEEKEEFKDILTHIDPDWVYDSFLESAIFNCRLKQKENISSGVECTVFRAYRAMAFPIIVSVDHSDFIDDLSVCKTFNEMGGLLNDAITYSSENKSLVTLCYELDKLLKNEINHVLRNKMSLNGVSIDSFIDDVKDLPEYLDANFGDKYKEIFDDFQKAYIKQMICSVKPDELKVLQNMLMDESELENKPVINFIAQNFSFTFVNVEDYELGIKPFDDCASSIIEEQHPLMYKIVSGIFNQDRDIERECLHNLIITSDNVIYEVQKGLVGNNFFTINKFVK